MIVVSDLMESALGQLLAWTKENGLRINPKNIELVLFIRRYNMLEFRLPKFGNTSLELSREAKTSRRNPLVKLSRGRNANNKMRKSLCAGKRTFGIR